MITSAISSAARLPLAPVKLAGRMTGALLRGLRGNDSRQTSSPRSSARAKPARRSRAKAQTKRATARSSQTKRATTRSSQTKRATTRSSQTKRATTRSSGKRQPERTAKRTATPARPKAQPSATRSKHTSGTEPRGDVAITREVESTIFRDIEADRDQVDVKVAEGVVQLRGEVPTPDLISELEARATRVPRVRRVENLLRTPTPSLGPATPAPQRSEDEAERPTAEVGTHRAQGPRDRWSDGLRDS